MFDAGPAGAKSADWLEHYIGAWAKEFKGGSEALWIWTAQGEGTHFLVFHVFFPFHISFPSGIGMALLDFCKCACSVTLSDHLYILFIFRKQLKEDFI